MKSSTGVCGRNLGVVVNEKDASALGHTLPQAVEKINILRVHELVKAHGCLGMFVEVKGQLLVLVLAVRLV